VKEKSTEERIILFFKLGKELREDYVIEEGNKNDRILARRLYKSFKKSYP